MNHCQLLSICDLFFEKENKVIVVLKFYLFPISPCVLLMSRMLRDLLSLTEDLSLFSASGDGGGVVPFRRRFVAFFFGETSISFP